MAGPANQDPRIASAPDSEALSQAIVDFDAEIAALRARFDQYFLGLDKINPGKDLEALKKRLLKFKTQPIRNTGIKFRVQTLYNKFQSYERLWTKSLKEIEEGTYRKDLLRLKRKNQARGQADPTAPKAKGPESEEQKPRPDFYTLDEDLEADLPIDIFEDDDVPAPAAKPAPAPVAAARPPAAPPAAVAAAKPPPPPAAAVAAVPGAKPPPAPAALSSTSKVGPAPTAPASTSRVGPAPTALSSTSKVGPAPTAPASTTKVGPAPGAPPRVGPPPAPGAPPVVRPAAPAAARPPPPPAGAAGVPVARPPAASSPPLAPRTATGSIPIPVAPAARPPPPPAAARAAAGPSADVPLSKEKLDQIYSAYITAKKRCKESTDGITPDALAQSLRKQVPALIEQHGAKSVDFKVVIKDGKAVLKAVPKG